MSLYDQFCRGIVQYVSAILVIVQLHATCILLQYTHTLQLWNPARHNSNSTTISGQFACLLMYLQPLFAPIIATAPPACQYCAQTYRPRSIPIFDALHYYNHCIISTPASVLSLFVSRFVTTCEFCLRMPGSKTLFILHVYCRVFALGFSESQSSCSSFSGNCKSVIYWKFL